MGSFFLMFFYYYNFGQNCSLEELFGQIDTHLVGSVPILPDYANTLNTQWTPNSRSHHYRPGKPNLIVYSLWLSMQDRHSQYSRGSSTKSFVIEYYSNSTLNMRLNVVGAVLKTAL